MIEEQDWTVIDTETTGLRAPIFVVEVAAQRMRGWEADGPSFRRLINQNMDIPPEASRVHGYTREILERDGDPADEVYGDFAAYVQDSPIVAYNLEYDWDSVLVPEWERLGIEPIGRPGFCAQRLAQRLLDPVAAGNCKLQTLRQFYRLPERGAHTALGDVETVVDLLATVLKPVAEHKGLSSWNDMSDFAAAEWYPSRLGFGKFKGRSIWEAQSNQALLDWLTWMSESKNLRSAKMGRWYLNLLKNSKQPHDVLLGGGTVESEIGVTAVTIYSDPEIAELRRLIQAARDRIAEIEVDYADVQSRMSHFKATLFNQLKDYYQRRDQLLIVIEYREKYLDTLLQSNEDEAENVKVEYEEARTQSDRDYEELAEESGKSVELSEEDKAELQKIHKKLVRAYHPDRFQNDPEKLETYTQLVAVINEARDRNDIELLRRIADDVQAFIEEQGWTDINLEDGSDTEYLRKLYESLQVQLVDLIDSLERSRDSNEYELATKSAENPIFMEEIISSRVESIEEEISELSGRASDLADEIEQLTGEEVGEVADARV